MDLPFDVSQCCGDLPVKLDEAYKPRVQESSFVKQLPCTNDITSDCSYYNEFNGRIFGASPLQSMMSFDQPAAAATAVSYLNTAPMWKLCQDNWKRIQSRAIKIARLYNDPIIISGVLGQLELTDIAQNNETKKMFLYDSDEFGKLYPIPMYFYKIIWIPSMSRGVVYLLINNPHIRNPEEYHICDVSKADLSKLPEKLLSRLQDTSKGCIYLCEVSDFVDKNIDQFPEMRRKLGLSEPSPKPRHDELK